MRAMIYRFQLSGKAVNGLLKLIKELLPQPNSCLRTNYSLKKYLARLFPHIKFKRHRYCKVCTLSIEAGEDACHGEDNTHFFIMSDIQKQLCEKVSGTFVCNI